MYFHLHTALQVQATSIFAQCVRKHAKGLPTPNANNRFDIMMHMNLNVLIPICAVHVSRVLHLVSTSMQMHVPYIACIHSRYRLLLLSNYKFQFVIEQSTIMMLHIVVSGSMVDRI